MIAAQARQEGANKSNGMAAHPKDEANFAKEKVDFSFILSESFRAGATTRATNSIPSSWSL